MKYALGLLKYSVKLNYIELIEKNANTKDILQPRRAKKRLIKQKAYPARNLSGVSPTSNENKLQKLQSNRHFSNQNNNARKSAR